MPVAHWTPLVAAALLALLWIAEGVAPMFAPRRGRIGHGARHLALGVINGVIAGVVFAAATALATEAARSWGFGLLHALGPPAWLGWMLALLMLDAWHYVFHIGAHKTPWLWRFHALHHSDTSPDATTAMRFHIVEIALMSGVGLIVLPLLGVTIEQVLLYELVLVAVSLFHHSNVRIPERIDRALRLLIATPRMHWVHHSAWQPQTDSNYGAVLSVWDRLGGTYRLADPRTIELGLDPPNGPEPRTLREMLASPWRRAHPGPGRRE